MSARERTRKLDRSTFKKAPHVPLAPAPRSAPPPGLRGAGRRWLKTASIVLGLGLAVFVLWAAFDLGLNWLDGNVSRSVVYGWARPLFADDQVDDEDEKKVVRPPLAISNAPPPGKPPAENLAWVPGGWFWMGDDEDPNAGPRHKVHVNGLWVARFETTNEEWKRFADETGYKTVAEKQPDPKHLSAFSTPDKGVKDLKPFSFVFEPPPPQFFEGLDNHHQWWLSVEGACWAKPEGKGSVFPDRKNHPVVHIAYVDAVAYCEWKSKKTGRRWRLPTEAEWELAARGGLDQKMYCWGDELKPGGKWHANIWQGRFPYENRFKTEDGHEGAAPAGSYPANGYGIHDMAGNVWEWCADWYQPDYYDESPEQSPKGPLTSHDPLEPGVPKRVQRGGSFLCADNYCRRYLPAARGKGDVYSSACHIGFRVVVEP